MRFFPSGKNRCLPNSSALEEYRLPHHNQTELIKTQLADLVTPALGPSGHTHSGPQMLSSLPIAPHMPCTPLPSCPPTQKPSTDNMAPGWKDSSFPISPQPYALLFLKGQCYLCIFRLHCIAHPVTSYSAVAGIKGCELENLYRMWNNPSAHSFDSDSFLSA